jgi:hypothetical protein
MRGEELCRLSDQKRSATVLPAQPALLLLSLQMLQERLFPCGTSSCPHAAQDKSSSLDLPEGVRRVLVVSSPDDETFYVCTILT